MNFISTRNSENRVSFKQAILRSMPQDGGLYVPAEDTPDLRRWILYADETTSFASLAGSLTSAMINSEFSPIICETIASHAFPKDPVFKKLDDHLFLLELYHGATGTFKDFGVSYLASALETVLQLDGGTSILLDATSGELGACMAAALKGKKLLKSVLLCPKGHFRGMDESDFVWNGGNIFPVEVDGTEKDCHDMVRQIFADKELVDNYRLTVANTANIGRLLPQSFFYTYAFSRLKKFLSGDIYYSFSLGNYGNLVSGLYGWKLSLPVNGFIVPASANLTLDVDGKCMVLDSMIPLKDRPSVDPSDPSNFERLEQVFNTNSLMLKNFVYPSHVTEKDKEEACKEMLVKYGIYADSDTSAAYACAKKRMDVIEEDEGGVVILARNSPSLDEDFIRHNLGEVPEKEANVINAFKPVVTGREPIKAGDINSLISILNSVNLKQIFQ